MYKLKTMRSSRKPLAQCTPDYKARVNRLYAEAHNDYLLNISCNTDKKLENDLHSFTDYCIGVEHVESASVSHNETVHLEAEFFSEEDSFSSARDVSVSVGSECDTLDYLETRLAACFSECNMTHQQIKCVLQVLRTHDCFSTIHIDPRTILKTPSYAVPIQKVAGGEYLHIGVRKGIMKTLASTPAHEIPDDLVIDWSTDEAALDKSSKILMWPIQIRIANIPRSSPEIVGIFKGSCKPFSASLFLKSFVEELLLIIENSFHGRTVKLRCFIADAPARAFILGHSGHNSKAPCSRCKVRGEWIRAGVIVFPGTEHVLRTQEEYCQRIDVNHHKQVCSMAALPLNVVSNTIFDYMHLVCLGVMAKIFQGIIDGRFVKSSKLPPSHIKVLHSRLLQVEKFCPLDFARKPVDVYKHSKMKATEQRQILLYSGPAIFYGLTNPAVYEHFLLLHAAIRILVNPLSSSDFIDFAENCIKLFVDSASDVYGIEFLSYNIHGLLHLSDDVRSFGPLDDYSAFPFENNMTYCRKLCRKPSQHLQQISNRQSEDCHINRRKYVDKNAVKFIGKHCKGPLPPIAGYSYTLYRKVVKGSTQISVLQQDNTIIFKNGSIGLVQNIIEVFNNGCYLLVKSFTQIENFFYLPCASSAVGVFLCSQLSSEMSLVNLDEVSAKCFRMPYWPELSEERSCPEYSIVVEIISSHQSPR